MNIDSIQYIHMDNFVYIFRLNESSLLTDELIDNVEAKYHVTYIRVLVNSFGATYIVCIRSE